MRVRCSPAKRLFILFLILMLPMFLFREYRLIKDKKDAAIKLDTHFYMTHELDHPSKSITILGIITEDSPIALRSFEALATQHYDAYSIILFDAALSDQKREQLQAKIAQAKVPCQYRKISSYGELMRQYAETVSSLPPQELILHLSCSDWLANSEVLEKINIAFSSQDVWIAYAQFLEYPTLKKGVSHPQPKKNLYARRIHRSPWMLSPLKVYYASLFASLDLLDEKKLHLVDSLSSIEELLTPIAEAGKNHVRFIPEALFVRTGKLSPSERFHLADFGESVTKSLFRQHAKLHQDIRLQMIIFSQKTPQELKQFLHNNFRLDVSTVVMYQKGDFEQEYVALQREFPEVLFLEEGQLHNGCREEILQCVISSDASNIILTSDQVDGIVDLNLSYCSTLLEKLSAGAFYFHLGFPHSSEQLRLSGFRFEGEGIYSFMAQKGRGEFAHPDSLMFTLYEKEYLIQRLESMSAHNLETFIGEWKNAPPGSGRALTFAHPKVKKLAKSKTVHTDKQTYR